MRPLPRSCSSLVLTALAALSLGAHAPQSPQSPAPPPATGVILGRVVDADTGKGVRAANVIIAKHTNGSGWDDRSTNLATITDANGRFVFANLPADTLSIHVTKGGYCEALYGQLRPFGESQTLTLAAGERRTDVVVRIWKQAAITGTVVDEAGEPVVGLSVQAFVRTFVAGRPRLAPIEAETHNHAETDDRGVYRIAQLVPGDYVVVMPLSEDSAALSTLEEREAAGTSRAAQRAIDQALSGAGINAGLPGKSYALRVGDLVRSYSNGVTPPLPGADGTVLSYPTIYYQGAATASGARTIALKSGEERANVDFQLKLVRTVRVSGILAGPDGSPAVNTAVHLLPGGEDGTDPPVARTLTDQKGTFTFLGVPPGQYRLHVLKTPILVDESEGASWQFVSVGSGGMTIVSATAPPEVAEPAGKTGSTPTLFASVPVSVGDQDVRDLTVVLHEGARVSGRIDLGAVSPSVMKELAGRFDMHFERADGVAPVLTMDRGPIEGLGRAKAGPTGEFQTVQLPPGRYLARVTELPDGWTLKSAAIGGRDVSDLPIDIRDHDITDVVLTFTQTPTTMSGTVRGTDGSVDPEATVLVFPTSPTGWRDYGAHPWRIRSTRVGRDGSYAIAGLPPGDYSIVAMHATDLTGAPDPDALQAIAGRATRLTLVEGDKKSQDLRSIQIR